MTGEMNCTTLFLHKVTSPTSGLVLTIGYSDFSYFSRSVWTGMVLTTSKTQRKNISVFSKVAV